MYKYFIRPILFLFNPETAHKLTFNALKLLRYVPFGRTLVRLIYKKKSPLLEKEVFGITFPNPMGLAGGLDKNGEYYNDLANFGFGFIEIGSLTPKPQDGNPKPRLFRSVKDKAIINRMGINNLGVKNAVQNLKSKNPNIIIAGNISKNTTSINEEAAKDYESAFALLYDFVDMFVINISCPNVVGLSDLQDITYLSDIMDKLISMRMYFDDYKPILLKVSPDINYAHLDDIINYCMLSGVDGIVATNTTTSRDGLTISEEKIQKIGNGGMSGAPLFNKSLEMVKYINLKSNGKLPIVGVGGIMTPQDAEKMFEAGASLIEIYSGFIYEGPGLVKNIIKHLEKKANND